MTIGPCGWVPTFTHLSTADQTEWGTYSAATQALCSDMASMVLWAATARIYGACPVIARPVLYPAFDSSVFCSGVTWSPVDIGSGFWINFPADQYLPNVDPFRVKLDGPVNAVTSVTIGGVLFASANYRLDEAQWLVRTDGEIWPLWQNIALPGTDTSAFVVNYTQGLPVPAALLAMAGTYALELARAMSPLSSTSCRLPSRVKTITRQGVTIDMVDPFALLDRNLTGIPEIDALIQALNPQRLTHFPRVLVPGDTASVVSA